MSNLLDANFSRLRKNKVFWLSIVLIFLWGILMLFDQYRVDLKSSGFTTTLDECFFSYAYFIGGFCAVFISLFLGTEYSDGTIRNKIVIGHSRSTIYLSNLIVNSCAAIMMLLAWTAAMILAGVPLLGWFKGSITTILFQLFITAFMIIAYCSLFTLICMLNQNKALSAVITVLIFFGILFLGSYCINRLSEPEENSFYPSESYILDSDDEYEVNVTIQGDRPSDNAVTEPNPKYVSGAIRTFFEFGADFLPGGQGIQIATATTARPYRMIPYSLLIICSTAGIGVLCFKHKDLK